MGSRQKREKRERKSREKEAAKKIQRLVRERSASKTSVKKKDAERAISTALIAENNKEDIKGVHEDLERIEQVVKDGGRQKKSGWLRTLLIVSALALGTTAAVGAFDDAKQVMKKHQKELKDFMEQGKKLEALKSGAAASYERMKNRSLTDRFEGMKTGLAGSPQKFYDYLKKGGSIMGKSASRIKDRAKYETMGDLIQNEQGKKRASAASKLAAVMKGRSERKIMKEWAASALKEARENEKKRGTLKESEAELGRKDAVGRRHRRDETLGMPESDVRGEQSRRGRKTRQSHRSSRARQSRRSPRQSRRNSRARQNRRSGRR